MVDDPSGPRPKKKRTRRGTKPDKIAVAAKRAKAMELRLQGKTLDQIAQELGYAGKQGAHKAIQDLLDRNEAEGVAEYRKVQGAELNALREAVWAKAMRGDPEAVRAALAVLAARSRLWGLDAARKFEFRATHRPQDVRAALLEELRLLDAAEAKESAK